MSITDLLDCSIRNPITMKLTPLFSLSFLAFCLLSFSSKAQSEEATLPQWIWTSKKAKPEEKSYFRKSFEIPVTTRRALLFATGDNAIDVYVNGSRRSVKTEQWEKPAVEDITDMLESGETNLIAARGANSGGVAGVLVMIELTDVDGSKTRIVSDESWKAAAKAEANWNRKGYEPKNVQWGASVVVKQFGEAPWGKVSSDTLAGLMNLRVPTATPVDRINLPDGFRAELLYSVPKGQQGSWVAMTIDDKERLIVSDQYGSLYRLQIPAPGDTISEADVEEIEVDIGGAQGLLYAFDSLYAVLNTAEHGGRGLYRITDKNGDDKFDTKELLGKFDEVGGEHGPHAVVLSPDGESIYVVAGNQSPANLVEETTEEVVDPKTREKKEVKVATPVPFDSSRVPLVWGEDLLLERPIGRGFMKGTLAPGGWIAKTDPDGKKWDLIATGFRNQYDIAFNRDGEMFTFDADMEWDMNTPWYRPTRVNHVTSGSEFGWRNGGGKWPAYYPDSLPAVVDVGPGSPTGVSFGYGAKFPEKYQDAFYVADWSYGKLYAVHMEEDGSSYTGKVEEFMSAQPLPLTDLLVNPKDGAMYVAIGGRRVQSGLYRVTYEGELSNAKKGERKANPLRELRKKLEALHREDPEALDLAIPNLGHEDRFIRFAARIAMEHQPIETWKEKVLSLESAEAIINGIIALARHGDSTMQEALPAKLNAIEFNPLSARQRTDLVRAYSLVFSRMGEGDSATRETIAKRFHSRMPFASPELNIEALELLVYLQAPEAAELGIDLLKNSPLQEEQMAFAKSLRHLNAGWNRELRKDFFQWFTRAKGYKGGPSFGLFIENMKKTALENTPEEEKIALKEIIEAEPPKEQLFTVEPRSFKQAWTVEDFDDVIAVGLEGNRNFVNGRKMFGATSCFACHRFNQQGGAIGPDLTSVAGKFSPRDLLESIIDPSKEISDQYGQMIFEMQDGSIVMGRIMNLNGDKINVNTNMMDPNQIVSVDRKRLKKMEESPVSMMPPGLINTLTKDDTLDLLAYLLSRGNPDDPMFAE